MMYEDLEGHITSGGLFLLSAGKGKVKWQWGRFRIDTKQDF
jgi:hypothetical protein